MCLRLGIDTKTGSKGSLGGGVTGGISLGVVSRIDFLKYSFCGNLGSYITSNWLEFGAQFAYFCQFVTLLSFSLEYILMCRTLTLDSLIFIWGWGSIRRHTF